MPPATRLSRTRSLSSPAKRATPLCATKQVYRCSADCGGVGGMLVPRAKQAAAGLSGSKYPTSSQAARVSGAAAFRRTTEGPRAVSALSATALHASSGSSSCPRFKLLDEPQLAYGRAPELETRTEPSGLVPRGLSRQRALARCARGRTDMRAYSRPRAELRERRRGARGRPRDRRMRDGRTGGIISPSSGCTAV